MYNSVHAQGRSLVRVAKLEPRKYIVKEWMWPKQEMLMLLKIKSLLDSNFKEAN
ncbi:hypothetical protein Scep_028209 [Stephania cephalantha]|uniref:Uncharacterized protein n=1 Tax=Stephania cephalantha TaxID=152367 RepID=A0AAP0HLK5_9MAGN